MCSEGPLPLPGSGFALVSVSLTLLRPSFAARRSFADGGDAAAAAAEILAQRFRSGKTLALHFDTLRALFSRFHYGQYQF